MRAIGIKINTEEVKMSVNQVNAIKNQIDSLDFNVLSISTRMDSKIIRKSYVSSSLKSIHKNFASISALLNNLSSFIDNSAEKYESCETQVVNASNKLVQERSFSLMSYGVNGELLTGYDVNKKSESSSRTFLKVSDYNSLGFVVKVVDGRMVVKVDKSKSDNRFELVALADGHEGDKSLNKTKFDDISSFIYVEDCSKATGNGEKELNKSLNVWDDFKPNEWRDVCNTAKTSKGVGTVSAVVSIVSNLETLQNGNEDKVKEFLVDAGIDKISDNKRGENSFLLPPVGTVVGSTARSGLDALENLKVSLSNYRNDSVVGDAGGICSNVSSTMDKVFW